MNRFAPHRPQSSTVLRERLTSLCARLSHARGSVQCAGGTVGLLSGPE